MSSMLKENVSLSQLAALIFNFQIGSTIAFGLGLKAKEDAWIALLISFGIGIIITLFFIFLTTQLPGKNLYEMFEYCFNRPTAIVVSFLYTIYFLYETSRILRDFGELISSIALPNTPIEISILTLTLLIGYILYLGLEVVARTSEIFTPYAIIFIILLIVFLYVSDNLDFSNIKPILGEGFSPIWSVIFPYEVVRPYGQLLILTILLNNVSNVDYSKLVILLSVIASSTILIVASMLIIFSLGEGIALRSTFPLLSTVRLVSIGEFFQRVDAIVVFIMMLGSLVKSSINLYAGLKGLEYIFRIPFRYFSIPISCLLSIFSVFITRNFVDHIQEGLVVTPYLLHIPLRLGFPLLLLFIILLKSWRKQQSSNSVSK